MRGPSPSPPPDTTPSATALMNADEAAQQGVEFPGEEDRSSAGSEAPFDDPEFGDDGDEHEDRAESHSPGNVGAGQLQSRSDDAGHGTHSGGHRDSFIQKLLKILGDSSASDVISWSPCGKHLVISDPKQFTRTVLPTYFRHVNAASFVRQMNMYGFKKLLTQGRSEWQFTHPSFQRDREDLLRNVRRRGRRIRSRPTLEIDGAFHSAEAMRLKQEHPTSRMPPQSDYESLKAVAQRASQAAVEEAAVSALRTSLPRMQGSWSWGDTQTSVAEGHNSRSALLLAQRQAQSFGAPPQLVPPEGLVQPGAYPAQMTAYANVHGTVQATATADVPGVNMRFEGQGFVGNPGESSIAGGPAGMAGMAGVPFGRPISEEGEGVVGRSDDMLAIIAGRQELLNHTIAGIRMDFEVRGRARTLSSESSGCATTVRTHTHTHTH
eukprot:Opistho-1_new@72271